MTELIQNRWNKLDAWIQKRTVGLKRKKYHENFLENLSMLYESGMGLREALDSLAQETRNAGIKTIIEEIRSQVQGGTSLWESLEQTKVIPAYLISLIRAGEESGQLSKNLQAAAIQQKKEREFQSKMHSAMLYPLLVLGVTLVVGLGITWFILPRLAKVFSQLDLELPILTKMLIGLGAFLQHYGWFAVPLGLAALAIIFYFLFFHPKTKQWGQRFLMRSVVTGELIQEMEMSRLGYIGGTLLAAGMPIEKTMEALEHSTRFIKYKESYIILKNDIEKGASFQQAFKSVAHVDKLVPVSVQQMINSAYSSGHLAETLIHIGEKYEAKMENTTKNLPTLLEPVLLVIIWLGVVAVALAVILPLYDLVGGFSLGGAL